MQTLAIQSVPQLWTTELSSGPPVKTGLSAYILENQVSHDTIKGNEKLLYISKRSRFPRVSTFRNSFPRFSKTRARKRQEEGKSRCTVTGNIGVSARAQILRSPTFFLFFTTLSSHPHLYCMYRGVCTGKIHQKLLLVLFTDN